MTLQPRIEAGVAALKASLELDVPLEDIVLAIWNEMRSARVPVGRPRYDETKFSEALSAVQNGEPMRSVRERFGFGTTVERRIKEAMRDVY